MSDEIILLAGVLLHEWVHMDKQGTIFVITRDYSERVAWSYQIRWLDLNSWDTKTWNVATRQMFKKAAAEARFNLLQNYGVDPLKDGF